MSRLFFYSTLAISLALLFGCRRESSHRTYVEKAFVLSDSARFPGERLDWERPGSWVRELPKGMRLASFNIVEKGRTASCTIVQLAGQGGDMEANIQRWMGQLKMVRFDSEEMSAFLKRQDTLVTATGQRGIYVDLTKVMTGDMTASESILGAVIPLEKSTVFVKMMGPKTILKNQEEAFRSLCESLKVGGE